MAQFEKIEKIYLFIFQEIKKKFHIQKNGGHSILKSVYALFQYVIVPEDPHILTSIAMKVVSTQFKVSHLLDFSYIA